MSEIADSSELARAARRLLVASNAGREAIGRVLGPMIRDAYDAYRPETLVMAVREAWLSEASVFAERQAAAEALETQLAADKDAAFLSHAEGEDARNQLRARVAQLEANVAELEARRWKQIDELDEIQIEARRLRARVAELEAEGVALRRQVELSDARALELQALRNADHALDALAIADARHALTQVGYTEAQARAEVDETIAFLREDRGPDEPREHPLVGVIRNLGVDVVEARGQDDPIDEQVHECLECGLGLVVDDPTDGDPVTCSGCGTRLMVSADAETDPYLVRVGDGAVPRDDPPELTPADGAAWDRFVGDLDGPDGPQWGWMAVGAERAHGPFATREQALADARDHIESGRVVLGTCRFAHAASEIVGAVDLDAVLERMDESTEMSWYDDEIFTVAPDRRKEAEAKLAEALAAWAREYVETEEVFELQEEPTPITITAAEVPDYGGGVAGG